MKRLYPRSPYRISGVVGLVAYLLVAAAVTGCERAPRPAAVPRDAPNEMLVAVIGACQSHPQWPGIRGGARRFHAGVPSVQLILDAPTEQTSDSLLATVTRVLRRHPQAACLHVDDPTVARAAVERLVEKNVVVVTMGAEVDGVATFGHVSVNLPAAAEMLGRNLAHVAEGRESYLLLHKSGANATATSCYKRFSRGVRHVGLHLLQEENVSIGRDAEVRAVQGMLGRFKHAGLLVTLDPDVWLTAQAGWDRRLRKLNGEFRIVTLSAAPTLWPRLSGTLVPAAALVGPLDGEIGFSAVEIARDALLADAGDDRSRPRRVINCELVTPTTLPDFAKRYSTAAGGLDLSEYLTKKKGDITDFEGNNE